MHRRAFLMNLAASVAIPRVFHAQTPVATPATQATGARRPDPIDLGEGISLIDFRIHPGAHPGIIGELRNDSDQMIDAPVVSISWPREGRDDGFSWLSPVIPVIDAGGSVPIYGSVPDTDHTDALLESLAFALCTPAEPGDYSALQSAMTLELAVTEERIEDSVYNARGTIANTGAEILRHVILLGVVRDRHGRIAGTTHQAYYSGFAVTSRAFSIWAGSNLHNKANPYDLISDDQYSVELYAGTRGSTTAPGCEFGFPWD